MSHALRAAGLSVSNCIPTVPSFLQLAIPGMQGPADPEERIEAICASIRRFAAYDPECVLCLSGPLGGRAEAEGRAIVVDGLRRAAAAAREAGVRLGFEPIHPAQRESAGFVTSLADALALLDEADADDVGIMADTFNLGHEPTDALARVAVPVHGRSTSRTSSPSRCPACAGCPSARAVRRRSSPRSAPPAGTARWTSRSSRHPRRSGRSPAGRGRRRALHRRRRAGRSRFDA